MALGHGLGPWPKAMAEGHGLGPWPEAMARGHGLGQKVVAAISSFTAAPQGFDLLNCSLPHIYMYIYREREREIKTPSNLFIVAYGAAWTG